MNQDEDEDEVVCFFCNSPNRDLVMEDAERDEDDRGGGVEVPPRCDNCDREMEDTAGLEYFCNDEDCNLQDKEPHDIFIWNDPDRFCQVCNCVNSLEFTEGQLTEPRNFQELRDALLSADENINYVKMVTLDQRYVNDVHNLYELRQAIAQSENAMIDTLKIKKSCIGNAITQMLQAESGGGGGGGGLFARGGGGGGGGGDREEEEAQQLLLNFLEQLFGTIGGFLDLRRLDILDLSGRVPTRGNRMNIFLPCTALANLLRQRRDSLRKLCLRKTRLDGNEQHYQQLLNALGGLQELETLCLLDNVLDLNVQTGYNNIVSTLHNCGNASNLRDFIVDFRNLTRQAVAAVQPMIGPEDISLLCDEEQFPALTNVILVNLQINDQQGQEFFTSLKHNKTIRLLNVSNNTFQTGAGIALAQALEENYTLEKLILENVCLSHSGAMKIAQSLRINDGLEQLSLCGNPLNNVVCNELFQCLRENKYLHYLNIQGQQSLSPSLLQRQQDATSPQQNIFDEITHHGLVNLLIDKLMDQRPLRILYDTNLTPLQMMSIYFQLRNVRDGLENIPDHEFWETVHYELNNILRVNTIFDDLDLTFAFMVNHFVERIR